MALLLLLKMKGHKLLVKLLMNSVYKILETEFISKQCASLCTCLSCCEGIGTFQSGQLNTCGYVYISGVFIRGVPLNLALALNKINNVHLIIDRIIIIHIQFHVRLNNNGDDNKYNTYLSHLYQYDIVLNINKLGTLMLLHFCIRHGQSGFHKLEMVLIIPVRSL